MKKVDVNKDCDLTDMHTDYINLSEISISIKQT